MRYLRLYLHFIIMSFGKATAYRFDFWCRILMDLAYYLVAVAFFQIIFLKTSLLGGWNEQQVMIFVAAHLVLDAIQMTCFSSNMWELPSVVNEGTLDHYLTKPVSTLFFITLQNFAVNSLINLGVAVTFLVWAIQSYPVPFSALQLLGFLFFLLNGVFLYYNARLLVALPVFWTQAPYGFERVFYSLMPFMERPDGLFRNPVRWVIFNIIPFALMASVPARVFFEGVKFEVVLHTLLITLLFFCGVQVVWRCGLKRYGSASS